MGLFKSSKTGVNPGSEDRDWQLVAELAHNSLTEQRKARRWGIFFKVLTFLYLFVVLFSFVWQFNTENVTLLEPHVALVEVNGVIAADADASANNIVGSLRDAFKSPGAKAVILAINSPGGSPVQSGYVYDEIKRLRVTYPDKKVYAVISDLGASGGYYIAAAADEIYADKASLVGSIGVTASSFGFVDTLDKLGVERRHFTAGEHKAFLDPFSPIKEDEKQFWQEVLKNTHQQFIRVVEEGRGDRLTGDPKKLYSGLIWNGEQALELGLIDGLGSAGFVAREIIEIEEVRRYGQTPSLLEELTGSLGISIGKGAAESIKSDAHFKLNY